MDLSQQPDIGIFAPFWNGAEASGQSSSPLKARRTEREPQASKVSLFMGIVTCL